MSMSFSGDPVVTYPMRAGYRGAAGNLWRERSNATKIKARESSVCITGRRLSCPKNETKEYASTCRGLSNSEVHILLMLQEGVQPLLAGKPPQDHLPSMCYCSAITWGDRSIVVVRVGLWAHSVFRPMQKEERNSRQVAYLLREKWPRNNTVLQLASHQLKCSHIIISSCGKRIRMWSLAK